jgi:hypothetical protein
MEFSISRRTVAKWEGSITSFLATDLSSFNCRKVQWYMHVLLHAHRRTGMGTYSNHSLLPRSIFVRQDSIDRSHSLLNIVLGEHLREEGEIEERERA